ncbi:hypothetical protein [Halomonas sp. H10-9-1]|uniref:hypothetical protein n=1 Tax=Halomonas sp. H10-9-1 TaxID=2950871 RepID=UPI0032DEDAC0
MKPFSILLTRLLGLYLFLSTLFAILPALLVPSAGELWSAELLPVLIATLAVPLVGGVLLWSFAGRLAGKLHGGGEADVRIRRGAAGTDQGGEGEAEADQDPAG